MRTSVDVCIVRGSNTGSAKSLDDALLDGTVVFKPKKGFISTNHVLSAERLRCGVAGAIEERKGFRLPPIKGFEFLSPFAHGCPGCWYVSDLRTGRRLMMNSCPSKNVAIRATENCLRGIGRMKAKVAFDRAIKKYRCDLLADEKKETTKTENLNKEKDMRLTKTDNKFDDSTGVAKPRKTASKKTTPKENVTSPKLAKDLKTLGKKAARQIAKRTSAVKPAPKGKKRCSRCRKILPLADFHRKTKSPDGKLGHCKACECAYQKRRRETRSDIPGKSAKTASKVTKKVVKKTVAAKKTAKKTAKKAATVKKTT